MYFHTYDDMYKSISGLGLQFHRRSPLYKIMPKVHYGCGVAVDTFNSSKRVVQETSPPEPVKNGVSNCNAREWKKVSEKELGICFRMIPGPTKKVIKGLKDKGFEVYLVGGCVRDVILKRTPKDFDIITSANLRQVKRAFSRCQIVGKRYPICHVHIDGTVIEVSSFNTCGMDVGWNVTHDTAKIKCDKADFMRWRNCLRRDFTINGLMYDPYSKLVYDYLGGLEDIKRAKVRTVIPASVSFQEDCARILRGIRIAARLGFRLSKETASSITALSSSVLKLDKGRLMMEMNYLLSYGSAEASLRTLWKFGLLDVLLPIQAAYFVRSGFKRRDPGSNMLLSLFANMDKLLAPDRPCHSSLWVGLLAFHKSLSERPRHPLVIATFCLCLHNGGDIEKSVKISRTITKRPDTCFEEVQDLCVPDTDTLVREVLELGRCVRRVLKEMTSEACVMDAMSKYPRAPFSNLVLISFPLYSKTRQIFDCVNHVNSELERFTKRGRDIDYEQLALGRSQEVRHAFARVVFDTIYPVRR